MSERTPPHDMAAEQALLGAALLDGRVLDDVDTPLEHFYRPGHAHLWGQLQRLRSAEKPTDAISVHAYLQQAGTLEEAGGTAYLHTLVNTTPTAVNASHWAGIVTGHARRRALVAAGQRITALGYATDGADDDDRCDDARRALDDALNGTGFDAAKLRTVGDNLDEILDELEKPNVVATTGLEELDERIGGLRPGELVVIGARPGVGKSILGAQLALTTAEAGKPALIASLEMSKTELTYRILANVARIDLVNITRRRMRDRDWDAVARATSRIAELPLHIDDNSSSSIADIRSRLRTMKRRRACELLVVDYLQLLRPSNTKSPRHEQVAEMSRGLKLIARDLELPVVALSQVNRSSIQRQDKRPSMSDLRESGAIEADADVVILLHVEADMQGQMELNVVKNRHGVQGITMCSWQPRHALVASLAPGWAR